MPMMVNSGWVSDPSSTVDPTPGSTPSSEGEVRRLLDGLQKEDSAMRLTIMAQMKVMQELVALKRRLKQKQKVLTEMNSAMKKQECSSSKTGGGAARSKNRQVPYVPGVEESVSTSLEQRAHALTAYAGRLVSQGEHYMQQDVDWAALLAAIGDPPAAQENSSAGAEGATLHPAVREPRMSQDNSCTAPDEASVPVPQWHGLRSQTPPTSSAASSSLKPEAGRPSDVSVPISQWHLQSSAQPTSSATSTSSWRPEAGVSSQGIGARMELAPEYAPGADDLLAEFIAL